MKKRFVLFAALGSALALCVTLGAQQGPATPPAGAAPGARGQRGGGRGFGPADAPLPQGQNPNGMHIYLYGGLKSHQVGQHDYPQFLADWSKILTEHGAVVDGALHAPRAEDLLHTDVVVIYKGDAGYMSPTEKADLDAYVKGGGGLVSFHDSLCGPDPAAMAELVGGGKQHGQVNYTLESNVAYTVMDPENPIMAGMPKNFTIQDEAFYLMTWAKAPGIHVLMNGVIDHTPSAGTHAGEVVPQAWTYEHTVPGGEPARAFVWMQGHFYKNFTDPQIEPMLLRGIAWAGKQPVNTLVDYKAPARGMGRGMGRGGRGRAAGAAGGGEAAAPGR